MTSFFTGPTRETLGITNNAHIYNLFPTGEPLVFSLLRYHFYIHVCIESPSVPTVRHSCFPAVV